jgi:acetyltransferase-like isoleucine patch superfamily enzyme
MTFPTRIVIQRLTGILWQRMQDRVAKAIDPEAFARSLGVRLNGTVKFYGINRAMFGSEPWLISFGDNVYVTSGVQFITHDGGTLILRKEIPDLEWTAPISVGNDVYFGVRALILPGVTIGNRCIIAAASVVTRDVPDNSVVGGVPARRISSVDEYMEKMKAKSLGLGHLSASEKAIQLKKYFGVDQI